MASAVVRIVAIVFVLNGAAVFSTQPKAQQAKLIIIRNTTSINISCSAGEGLVLTNSSRTNGRETNSNKRCSKFIIGWINFHCKFKDKCDFKGTYPHCSGEKTNFLLDYYCLRNDSFHKSCIKTIRAGYEHSAYGILTSSSYPSTKERRVCTYQFLVPPGNKVRLTVFDCYFNTTIQNEKCSLQNSVPKSFQLSNSSVILIQEKPDHYAGFLAMYVVEHAVHTTPRSFTTKHRTTTAYVPGQVTKTKRVSTTVNSAQTSKIKVFTAMYSTSEENDSDQVPKKTTGIRMIAGICITGVLLIVGGIVGVCCYYKRNKRTDFRRKPAMRDITNFPQKNSDGKTAHEHEMYATINDVDAASAEGKTRNGEKEAGYAICSAHESVPYANMSASDPAMPVYAEVNDPRKLNEKNDSVKSEKTPGEITYADVVICNQGDGNAKKGVVGEYQHAGDTVYAEIQK